MSKKGSAVTNSKKGWALFVTWSGEIFISILYIFCKTFEYHVGDWGFENIHE